MAGEAPDRERKTLVFLSGPPAVGKMTVGRELSRLTGFPLFHNHMSIEAVLPIFGFGEPAFNRLVTMLRREVFAEAAQSDLPGLIFTFVWSYSDPDDLPYVRDLTSAFETHGGRVVYPELWADLETRLGRNTTAGRLEAKASKRDVEASRRRLLDAEEKYQLSSNGDFPLSPHLFIANSTLTPLEAAERIVGHFALGRRDTAP